MARVEAARELLAPRKDVWAFVAEPYHLADWWPGVAGVQPDRRGFAPGARWEVRGADRPTLFRAPSSTGMLIVLEVEAPSRWRFQLTGDRLEAELRLDALTAERTLATLSVEGPLLVGLRRSFARKALGRLYALCQTGAGP